MRRLGAHSQHRSPLPMTVKQASHGESKYGAVAHHAIWLLPTKFQIWRNHCFRIAFTRKSTGVYRLAPNWHKKNFLWPLHIIQKSGHPKIHPAPNLMQCLPYSLYGAPDSSLRSKHAFHVITNCGDQNSPSAPKIDTFYDIIALIAHRFILTVMCAPSMTYVLYCSPLHTHSNVLPSYD